MTRGVDIPTTNGKHVDWRWGQGLVGIHAGFIDGRSVTYLVTHQDPRSERLTKHITVPPGRKVSRACHRSPEALGDGS